MPKYVATRKDICAGKLIRTDGVSFKVFDSNNNEVSQKQLAEQGINITFFSGLVCRGMLFNVNEDGLANDLIYTTPTNYPIRGIEPKTNVDSEFIIDNYVELEELLKYLKYGVDLTQRDLNQIYRKLITHKWWLEHHRELFGWKKLDNGMGYCNGETETIPMKIYDNLSSISCTKNGKPYREEPGYVYIMKRKNNRNMNKAS